MKVSKDVIWFYGYIDNVNNECVHLNTIVSLALICISCNIVDIKRLQDEADCFSEEQGWKLFKTTKLAEIWKKNDDSSPVQQIKVNKREVLNHQVCMYIYTVSETAVWNIHLITLNIQLSVRMLKVEEITLV